jgi:hypothetical protein
MGGMNTIQTWTTSKTTKDLGWCKKMMIITWQLRGVCVEHLNSFAVTWLFTIDPTQQTNNGLQFKVKFIFFMSCVWSNWQHWGVWWDRYIHVEQASTQASKQAEGHYKRAKMMTTTTTNCPSNAQGNLCGE